MNVDGLRVPFTTRYGVARVEVARFVEQNAVVKDWLGRYHGKSWDRNAYKLCRFFKWLKVVKGVDLSPKELLNEQIQLGKSEDIEERRKHLRWVLEHTRDNPDFESYSDDWKYLIFLAIRKFYDYHGLALPMGSNLFGRHTIRKNKRKQITLVQAKNIINLMPQRERAILTIILQSGMEVGAVLNKMNFMWDIIIPQIKEGRPRVKVEFNGRKGNSFPYFTFFSRDAIQELKKWLFIRERIVMEKGELKSHPIFITREATPYLENNFYTTIDYYRKRKNVPNFVPHQFRKLFKTEASIPERGIDRSIVEFWMGHKTLVVLGKPNPLGAVGGIYDRTPEIYEGVIEKEYVKLEPFINIYSGVQRQPLTDEDLEWMKFTGLLRNALENDRKKREKFLKFFEDL